MKIFIFTVLVLILILAIAIPKYFRDLRSAQKKSSIYIPKTVRTPPDILQSHCVFLRDTLRHCAQTGHTESVARIERVKD